MYPANFVSKRWEKRETNSLADAFAWIREKTAEFEADWIGKS